MSRTPGAFNFLCHTSRVKPDPKSLALLAFGAAAALALAEAALRLWIPAPRATDLRDLHEYRPDRSWLYGLRPGAEGRIAATGDVLYRINADGFRGPRYERPRPDGRWRIVVLGDSVAFGYGVEESQAFPQVLEARLSERLPGAGFEVVNLGVGGYNAWNELELLRDVGIGYQPDLVLVQFCINDLNDPTMHFDAQTRLTLDAIPDAAFPDPSRRRGSQHEPSLARGWCARSKLCSFVRERWMAARPQDFDEAARRAAGMPIERPDAPEWAWLEERYREMAEVAQEAGARFAVLVFPYRAELDAHGPDRVQDQLRAIAHQNGWPIVDPLPRFRAEGADASELFVDWWHPTAAGHRIAAEVTLESLACGGVLGERGAGACPASARRTDARD
jgi:lysophospholipase L1-like esterase